MIGDFQRLVEAHSPAIAIGAFIATFIITFALLRLMRHRAQRARTTHEGAKFTLGLCLCCGPNVTSEGECLCTRGACGVEHRTGDWLP